MKTKLSKNQLKQALKLYAVSDSGCLRNHTLEQCTREIIAGGATIFQYRNKNADLNSISENSSSNNTALEEAKALQRICADYNIPFIVNDNVQLASQLGADGVHVGQGDMPCAQVRDILGHDAIIGVSAQTVEQAMLAQEQGADYLGVGAVIPTSTKPDAEIVSIETLQKIIHNVEIPVVAIGGINATNVSNFKGCGIAGVAVVSALFGAIDPRKAAQELVQEVNKIL